MGEMIQKVSITSPGGVVPLPLEALFTYGRWGRTRRGFMKRAIISIITVIVFSCIWNVNPMPTSLAQRRGQGESPLMREAQQVWKGEYSPEDLRKWEKRAKKLRSNEKWSGVALCYNVIGVIHRHQGNLGEALRHLDQSLEITRKHRIERLTARLPGYHLDSRHTISREPGLAGFPVRISSFPTPFNPANPLNEGIPSACSEIDSHLR
jgi:hypothetical protein